MTEEYTIAAGLDIHKRFIIATVLHTNGVKFQQRFERTMQGILALKDWVLVNKYLWLHVNPQVITGFRYTTFYVIIWTSL